MGVDTKQYHEEITRELESILTYWMHYAPDKVYGGFHGKIDCNNVVIANASKGIVLNSRILWTFSAAYNNGGTAAHLLMADSAYDYITTYFIDKEFGGVYWSVDYTGDILESRKQLYGLAFALYALSEYYKATGLQKVKEQAIALFHCIEQYGFDPLYNGYIEAFSRDWKILDDVRLSDKDNNEIKTMNTHLHIAEAYANLYNIWPDATLKQQIENLLFIFDTYIIGKDGNMGLFFDDQWHAKSAIISYGHQIEAAWLLQHIAEAVGSTTWIDKMKTMALVLTQSVVPAVDGDGGLWYESNAAKGLMIKEKHWWPQAEAMIGFMNAYQLTGKDTWLQRSWDSWQFVKNYIKDKTNGEWVWGLTEDYSIMQWEDKAGFWKCPYHNTRACIELQKRLMSVA